MDSNDIGSAIGKLLEDPETLSRLMSVAGGIMEGMKQEQGEAPHSETGERAASDGSEPHTEAFSRQDSINTADTAKLITSLLGGIKPNANDPRCALLYALKPYLGKQRAERIDTLVKALGVSELASGFLNGSGLFS